jgi:1,4-alpha-glucan branching enzyme
MAAMQRAWLLLLAGCSLTPIPDVSSSWSPPCDDAKRTCSVEFTLDAGTEKSVELRGDFAPGAWKQGVAMVKTNGQWTASIDAGWGASIQYKFFVDAMTWETDPGNPSTVKDSSGNVNSLRADIECVHWICAE